MKISDELRNWCDMACGDKTISKLADRIDSEMVEQPKDRNGRILHIGDEVLVYRCEEPIAQGEVLYMTLTQLNPVTWYMDLYEGAVGDMRYRTRCGCFNPHDLERIEVGSDGSVG